MPGSKRYESRDVPVMRPSLPVLEELEPYLRAIERNRWYSNFGPLVVELEQRLALALGGGTGAVVTANNGTAALTAALMALEVPPGGLVAVPSWTFCASAHAVLLAGLTPYLVDVDGSTWVMGPDAVRAAMTRESLSLAAVMPVVPFGAPLDDREWRRFRAETGIPVLIDAAAAFDTWRASDIPAAISLHATKTLGAGEGGLVVSADPAFIKRVRQALNFGFRDTATAQVPASNGKMSEYAAAVALAALDGWSAIRADWCRAAALYAPLAARQDIVTQAGFGRDWVGSAFVVRVPGQDGRTLATALAARGIQTRLWWPLALCDHPAFASCPGDAAPVGRRLARECLGLPYYRDVAPEDVAYVIAALVEEVS